MNVLQKLEAEIAPLSKLQAEGTRSASLAILETGSLSTHLICDDDENDATAYQCGSISKAITALGVARLVDRGHLSYDSKIVDFLSQGIVDSFLEPEAVPLLQHVTVQMLLTHMSGLAQPTDTGHPESSEQVPTAKDVLANDNRTNTLRLRFNSFPGAQLMYCSGAFTLLQLAMEQVCGKPFPELMMDLVLRPLQMTRSFYGDPQKREQNIARPYLTGYQADPLGYHRFSETAAVGLWSTPSDLLKCVAAIQSSLFGQRESFLKQTTAHQVLKGGVQFRSGAARHHCGLGWFSTATTFAHRGGNPGYHAYVFGFFDQSPPELHDCGFAIMTNSQMGLDTIRPIVSAILYLKGWPRQPLMPSSLGTDTYRPFAAPHGTEIDPAWKEWQGLWEGEWSLLERDGLPAVQFRDHTSMEFRAAAAPVHRPDNGLTEMMLVASSLHGLTLRLTWEDGKRVVEILQLQSKILRDRSNL